MITAAAPTAPRALHREDLHDRLNCPTVATRQSSAYSPIVASTRLGITSLLGAAVRIPQVGFRTSQAAALPSTAAPASPSCRSFLGWKLMGVIDPGRGQHDRMSRWTLTRLGRRPKVSVLAFSWRGFGRGEAALHTRERGARPLSAPEVLGESPTPAPSFPTSPADAHPGKLLICRNNGQPGWAADGGSTETHGHPISYPREKFGAWAPSKLNFFHGCSREAVEFVAVASRPPPPRRERVTHAKSWHGVRPETCGACIAPATSGVSVLRMRAAGLQSAQPARR